MTTKQRDFHHCQMDIRFDNHGSIWLANPLTEAGRDWMSEHLPDDAQTWGEAVVIEPRYVADIAQGARDDGLEVGAA
jgi:hypothetical protein